MLLLLNIILVFYGLNCFHNLIGHVTYRYYVIFLTDQEISEIEF